MDSQGAAEATVLRSLAGCGEEWAWQRRRNALDCGIELDALALSLAGLDTIESHALRRKLLDQGAGPEALLLGLAGTKAPQGFDLREKLCSGSAADLAAADEPAEQRRFYALALSLAGEDWPEFEAVRNGFAKNMQGLRPLFSDSPGRYINSWNPASVLRGVHAYFNRNRVQFAAANLSAVSTAGLNTKAAWDIRYAGLKLLERRTGLYPEEAEALAFSLARSVAGLDSSESMNFRGWLRQCGCPPLALGESLIGVWTPPAAELRDLLVDLDCVPGALQSLAGASTLAAHELRERLISTLPGSYAEQDLALTVASPLSCAALRKQRNS